MQERRRVPRGRISRTIRKAADVTAVIVAHDGAEWLPEALAALAASKPAPGRVICVDTGSTDDSAELLAEAYGEVLRLPRETGFGAAVAAALAEVPETTWVWLLHDDVLVEPTTLHALLDHATTSPSAVLLGPKVRDWHDPRYLVEVGVTTDAAGHRETGLERREYDQGQHDGVRDVLAVGTAAALVRRDAWDEVGGIDPRLPVFRDDLDLGWKLNAAGHRVVVVPRACVRHVRAATTGHRASGALVGRATGIDRRHALYVLLAHASSLRLLGLIPRLLIATLVRSIGLLLTRQVGAAGDEWHALLGVLGHPRVLRRARKARAATRTVSQRELRPLFASRALRIRARLGALADWLGGGAPVSTSVGALGDPGPEGPDAMDDLAGGGPGLLRSLLLRPGVLLFLTLSAIALLAERSVLAVHGTTLYGGSLLAAPPGAADLWSAYGAAWHEVSVGTRAAAPPATAALALLSTIMLGKPWVAVSTLVLASVPLAGATAYFAATRLVRHTYLRVWAAATWALLPVATGTVAAGRLDAAVLQIALPLLALGAGRVLTTDPGQSGWWRVWGLGLALGVTCAFAPLLWPLAVLVLLGAVVLDLVNGRSSRALAAVVVAVVPLLVLFPWSLMALREPSLFLVGQHPGDLRLPAWHLLLLSPGGPGVPLAVLTVGVVLGGLGGLIRLRFRRLAEVSWAVALVGLSVAAALLHVHEDGRPVWPGIPLQLAGVGVLVAALVGASGVRTRLAGYRFGWRQVTATLVAGLAAVAPVLLAVGWVVRGADDPLRRHAGFLLPAFARAELSASPGLKALALLPRGDGRLQYDVIDGDGTGLADAGLRPTTAQRALLDRAVADLATPSGSDAAEALSTRAVRYVVLRPGPGHDDLVHVLDAQRGLVRRTSADVDVWRVSAPSSRLTLLPPALAAEARSGSRAPDRTQLRLTPPIALPAGRQGATATIGPGPAGRLLVLTNAREPGWHATLEGKPLPARTAWGWAQAFEVPPEGGLLRLTHTSSTRRTSLGIQAVLVLGVVVLSIPAGRRRKGLEDDVDEIDEDDEGLSRHGRHVAVVS